MGSNDAVAWESDLGDVKHAAAYLDTSERHVRRLVAERRLAFVRVGRWIRFSRADLDAFIEARRVEAAR